MIVKRLLYTGFFTGYSPVAPGTVATLLAAALFIGEFFLFGSYCRFVNGAAVVILFYPVLILCGEGERYFGEKDPGKVVLDEVMGYWVSVLFHPFSWSLVVSAFFLFRLADIIKPFPARRFERMSGGTGILMDDIVAGLYANAGTTILLFVTGIYSTPPL